ncbi:hypothetical protein C5L42_29915 [Pseudomonas aeruginosa]|nr:hypothetical protein C5L42_29915 [Pseudomonas aeruginosa]TKW63371.1 MAG: hypothetical protein DI616_19620 [Paracoccus denitrificans]
MAEWQLADYAITLLPNFYPGARQTLPGGASVVIDRAGFTKSPWGGTPQFAADARKAMTVKDAKARARVIRSVCDAEREALATALMLELFGISDLDPLLARLPKIDELTLLTVGDADKKAISEAFSVWLR